jgi:hypothetical protein
LGNVLMIGLGGTGIKTLVQIKHQLKASNPDGQIPQNIHMLGIDSIANPETVEGVYDPIVLDNPEDLVRLHRDEFVTYQGYLRNYLRDVRNTQLDRIDASWHFNHPLIWMDVDWYLHHPSSFEILTTGNGVGMHRQVGRLTLWAMLLNGENSHLYQKLSYKISALYSPNAPKIYLLVFGSLVGGTGSSMLVDIPYLVKYISAQHGMVSSNYGFFALPDAFRHTSQVFVDESMRARAFAAMRELERVNQITDVELDYRMDYDADGIVGLRTQGSAYGMMYLFDQRADFPLETDVAHGVCATMASFAWMFTDGGPGTQLAGHLANRSAHLGHVAAQFNYFNPSVCASFGTYSYVLPIGAMVESWTHRFAMEALETLVPRDEETNRILTNFVGGELVRPGGRSVKEVLINDLGSQMGAFIKDLTEIGLSVSGGDAQAPHQIRLDHRSVSEWIDVIRTPDPTDIQKDIFELLLPKNTYFCKVVKSLFGERIIVDDGAMVQLEDPKNYGNSNEETANSLINNYEKAYNKKTNLWIKIIAERIDFIFDFYTTWLLDKTDAVLNGKDFGDDLHQAIAKKAGRLGWWWDFLGELVKGLEGLQEILRQQKLDFKQEYLGKGSAYASRYHQLIEKASKKNQKKYLKYKQDIFNIHRKLLFLTAELYLVENICSYTRDLLNQVTGYINTIIGDNDDSLRGFLQASRKRIDQNRQDPGKFSSVREYIYDPEWEHLKYQGATQADNKNILPMWRLMDDLHWKVAEVTVYTDPEKSQEVPRLTLEVDGFERVNHGYLRENKIGYYEEDLTQQEKKVIITAAIVRLLARCRNVFLPVWDHISVLDYLVDKWNGEAPNSPTNFAERVLKKVGVVLDGLENQPTAERSLFYLFPHNNNPNHGHWLHMMYESLSAIMGVQHNHFAGLDHSDPTTFTVVSYIDFVDYHKIHFWGRGREAYLRYLPQRTAPPQFYRSLLHVMKAEQNAGMFEREHLLSPVVVDLCKDLDKLSLFVAGLVWGFVKLQYLEEGGAAYCLELPPLADGKDSLGHTISKPYFGYLTRPDKYQGGLLPPLTEAAQTFCLRESVYNRQKESSNLLSMKDFQEHLAQLIEQDITQLCQTYPESPNKTADSEKLQKLVIKQKYLDWISNASVGQDTQIDEILARFDNAREHDLNNQLLHYSDIEYQFLKQVVQRMIEYSINHGAIYASGRLEY